MVEHTNHSVFGIFEHKKELLDQTIDLRCCTVSDNHRFTSRTTVVLA